MMGKSKRASLPQWVHFANEILLMAISRTHAILDFRFWISDCEILPGTGFQSSVYLTCNLIWYQIRSLERGIMGCDRSP